jgi:hypothetical protein
MLFTKCCFCHYSECVLLRVIMLCRYSYVEYRYAVFSGCIKAKCHVVRCSYAESGYAEYHATSAIYTSSTF